MRNPNGWPDRPLTAAEEYQQFLKRLEGEPPVVLRSDGSLEVVRRGERPPPIRIILVDPPAK